MERNSFYSSLDHAPGGILFLADLMVMRERGRTQFCRESNSRVATELNSRTKVFPNHTYCQQSCLESGNLALCQVYSIYSRCSDGASSTRCSRQRNWTWASRRRSSLSLSSLPARWTLRKPSPTSKRCVSALLVCYVRSRGTEIA